MNSRKNFFFLFFIFILLSFSYVRAYDSTEAQVCYGLNEEASFVSTVSHTYAQSTITQTEGAPSVVGSINVPPLVGDLDLDGEDEIVIFREGEIRVLEGGVSGSGVPAIILSDAYVNTTINATGAALADDTNNNGYPEIVVYNDHETAGGYHVSFLEFYSGTIYHVMDIENSGDSSGAIVCDDFFGNSTQECLYLSKNDEILGVSMYKRTGLIFNQSYIGGTGSCTHNPILSSMDFTGDGHSDLAFIDDSDCDYLVLYENEIVSKGNFTPRAAFQSSNGMEINQFAMADVDGGTKEIAMIASWECSSSLSNGCDSGSQLVLYNMVTYNQKCSTDLDKGYESPYNIALFTCTDSDGATIGGEPYGFSQCDVNGDGFKEVLVAQVWRGALNRHFNLTIGAYPANCNSLGVKQAYNLPNPTTGYANTYDTGAYMKAITANVDTDDNYELILPDGLVDWKNTDSLDIRLFNGTGDSGMPWQTADSYIFLADIFGDGTSEIFVQYSSSDIEFYSYDYTNTAPDFPTLWGYSPDSPICPNQTVTFYATNVDDAEGDDVRLIAKCFQNSSNSTGSWYSPCATAANPLCIPDPQVSCTYTELGDYIVTLYLQDSNDPYNLSIYRSFHYSVDDSADCHVPGDESGWTSTGGSTSAAGASGDLVDAFASTYAEFGLRSTASKALVAIIALVALNAGLIVWFIKSHTDVNFQVQAWVTIIASIGLALIRLLPSWYMVLMIFLGVGMGAVQGVRLFMK